MAVDKADRASL